MLHKLENSGDESMASANTLRDLVATKDIPERPFRQINVGLLNDLMLREDFAPLAQERKISSR